MLFRGLALPGGTLFVYFAFDLLMLNGNDLRNEPLLNRKSLLERNLKKAPRLRYDHVVGDTSFHFKQDERLRDASLSLSSVRAPLSR